MDMSAEATNLWQAFFLCNERHLGFINAMSKNISGNTIMCGMLKKLTLGTKILNDASL